MAPLPEVFSTLTDRINELVTAAGSFQFPRDVISVPSTEWVEAVKKVIFAVNNEANTGEGESVPGDWGAALEKGIFGIIESEIEGVLSTCRGRLEDGGICSKKLVGARKDTRLCAAHGNQSLLKLMTDEAAPCGKAPCMCCGVGFDGTEDATACFCCGHQVHIGCVEKLMKQWGYNMPDLEGTPLCALCVALRWADAFCIWEMFIEENLEAGHTIFLLPPTEQQIEDAKRFSPQWQQH